MRTFGDVIKRKRKEQKNARSAVDKTHQEEKKMPKGVNYRIEIRISHKMKR